MVYPVQRSGPLEVHAPVLRLLPPNYLINVRFMTPAGKTGSSLLALNSAPVTAFVKVDGIGNPEPLCEANAPFRTAFKMELGTAWVHTDWILLAFLLMLSNLVRRTCVLLGALILLRVVVVQSAIAFGVGFPWPIPAWFLCLPLVLLAWVSNQPKHSGFLPLLATAGAGLLLTLYDLQFLSSLKPAPSLSILLGYHAGFLAGFLLALAILFLVDTELKKSLQFHSEWRRRIGWAIAGISVWISFHSLIA